MIDIPEYKRDASKDYLIVLRSLNEIPFPLGKNLLIDFLVGENSNNSIEKNKMYNLKNFGALKYLEKKEILILIENLITNAMIDISGSVFNRFAKVLSISFRGKEELINPTLNSKKASNKYQEIEVVISDEEIRAFKELENFLGGNNLEQKKAIISNSEKILCIAGAGSGKTTVLAKRIQFLNKYQKVKGEKMLAITFTRKAREEMQRKLAGLNVMGVNVETFNSFCEKILLKNGGRVYGKKVRVANYQEKMIAILRALENMDMNIQEAVEKYFNLNQRRNKNAYQLQNMFVNDCFAVFDYFKLTKKDLDNSIKKLSGKNNDNTKMVFNVVKFLMEYMGTAGLRTYADQIVDVVNFFKLYPKFIPTFEFIFVDEFQDVNSIQIEVLNLLNPKNLFCVGDPRQSIFGWRGSKIDYILDFYKDYANSEIITLKKNYRSSKHLINFMNESIRVMKMPDLESTFIGEKNIKINQFSNEVEEFKFVLDEILSLNLPREEIFVLARTNRQLLDFSKILEEAKIEHILKNENSKGNGVVEGKITLSTIHAIKGLEAEVVFVLGCNQINFPCKSSEHPVMDMIKMYEYDKEEEERRLFYVAISKR